MVLALVGYEPNSPNAGESDLTSAYCSSNGSPLFPLAGGSFWLVISAALFEIQVFSVAAGQGDHCPSFQFVCVSMTF